ncbi:hypothetical protein [Singapore grouper iridovirus]|nr:hypothetical protein [Singapore grouper iridovirus]
MKLVTLILFTIFTVGKCDVFCYVGFQCELHCKFTDFISNMIIQWTRRNEATNRTDQILFFKDRSMTMSRVDGLQFDWRTFHSRKDALLKITPKDTNAKWLYTCRVVLHDVENVTTNTVIYTSPIDIKVDFRESNITCSATVFKGAPQLSWSDTVQRPVVSKRKSGITTLESAVDVSYKDVYTISCIVTTGLIRETVVAQGMTQYAIIGSETHIVCSNIVNVASWKMGNIFIVENGKITSEWIDNAKILFNGTLILNFTQEGVYTCAENGGKKIVSIRMKIKPTTVIAIAETPAIIQLRPPKSNKTIPMSTADITLITVACLSIVCLSVLFFVLRYDYNDKCAELSTVRQLFV